MNKVISQFAITYDGNDADNHIINAAALGESIIGASKFYNSVAHYCSFGFVPHRNYKRQFECYASVPRDGSYEYLLFIASQEYGLHAEIYKPALDYLFSKVVKSIKDLWTGKGKTEKIVETLVEALLEQRRIDADIESQLINSITKSNDHLTSLHSQLIATLPQLANATRKNGKKLVYPIGNTCRSIKQFSGTSDVVLIDEPDAEAIRGDDDTEVEDMKSFICNRITEINIKTGHCILEIDGFIGPIVGKISDPTISIPNNVYTRCMNSNTPFIVSAKTVKKNGIIYKLFISDANDNIKES